VGANLTVTGCDPPGAMVPLVQLGEYPPGTVIPVTESVPVPLLPIVNVNSAVLPVSTVPKARFPLSEITLVTEEEAGVEADVGAVGLAFSHADTIRAKRRTNRPIGCIDERSSIGLRVCKHRAVGCWLRAAGSKHFFRVLRVLPGGRRKRMSRFVVRDPICKKAQREKPV
jgi:hypothetical protein